jgi:hypothetical protein
VATASTRVAPLAKLAITGHVEVAGALMARASRDNARTALAAGVTAAMVNVLVSGIANTIPAEVDGAAMVNAPVLVASTVLAVVNIASTTPAVVPWTSPGPSQLQRSALCWHSAHAPSAASAIGSASRRGRPS